MMFLPTRLEGPRLAAGLTRLALASVQTSRAAVRRGLLEVAEAIERERLLRPVAVCRVFPAKVEQFHLRLGDGQVIEAEDIARLAGAAEVAVVFTTLGGAWSEAVTACFARGDALGGVLLDEVGSLALGRLARRVEAMVRLAAWANGRHAGSPLQPGHSTFPFSVQFKLAELAGIHEAGISITATGMLTPAKSVSMLIGIGNGLRRWTRASVCRECPSFARCRLARPGRECSRGEPCG